MPCELANVSHLEKGLETSLLQLFLRDLEGLNTKRPQSATSFEDVVRLKDQWTNLRDLNFETLRRPTYKRQKPGLVRPPVLQLGTLQASAGNVL